MTRLLAVAGVLIGVVAVVVGALLQTWGVAAVVFCSVIGAGILLILAGVVVWIVGAVRPGRPTQLAA